MPQRLELKRRNTACQLQKQIHPSLSNAVSGTHSFSPAVRGPGGLCGLSPPRAAGGLHPALVRTPSLVAVSFAAGGRGRSEGWPRC